MAVQTASFDLTREPWVPVLVAGAPVRLSLRELVERPDAVDGLDLADPLAAIAVLRQVLVPLWVDALGLPADMHDWGRRWAAPRSGTSRLLDYLDEHAERFDLLHPVAPFAQVAGLHTSKNETKPVSVLSLDHASGNNVPLFSSRTEADPPALSLAAATLTLLVAQCFDTAAIKSGAVGDPKVSAGKTTGNPTGPAGQFGLLVPTGRDLFQTLMLNQPYAEQPNAQLQGGTPQWRRSVADASWQERPPDGLSDLLTWQSRRIRLVPTVHEPGQGEMVVRQVVLAAGDRFGRTPEFEPHTAWKQNPKPKAGEPAQRARRHSSGRAAWRGMEALLATRLATSDGETSSLLVSQLADLRAEGLVPADLQVQLLVAQVVYGNQSAVVEDVVVDTLPLPVSALPTESPVRELLVTMAAQAGELQRATNRLGDAVRESAGGDRVPWDRSQRIGDTLVQDLTPVVRRLLRGLQCEPDAVQAATAAWLAVARSRALAVVEPLLSAAPASSFSGRTKKGNNGQEYTVRLAGAEAAFRWALNEILGPVPRSPIEKERV